MLLSQGELFRDRLADIEAAARCFRAAAEHESGRLPALLALEQLYQKQRSWRELAQVYAEQAQVFSDEGSRVAALRELARLQELQAVSHAERSVTYRTILSYVPGDQACLSALERIGQEIRDSALLVEVYRVLADGSADASVAADWYTRLGHLLEQNQDPSAREAYRRAITAESNSLTAIRGLGRIARYHNDWRDMAEAARLEAAIITDPQRAARLWRESGVLRLEHGDDANGALQDVEQALASWPDDVEAASALVEPLLKSGRAQHLVDLLSQSARSALDPQRKTELWVQVSDLCEHQLGDLGTAVAALQLALDITPGSVPALCGLGALHARNQHWNAAVNCYERALAVTKEPEETCRIHLELNDICLRKLGDPKRGLEHVHSVLALSPLHPEALARLAECQLSQGNSDAAASTARSLVAASRDTLARARALVGLARIELARGAKTAGEDALTEALAIQGPGGEAAEFFQKLAREHGSWVGYAAGLAAHLIRAGSGEVPYAGGRGAALAYLGLAQVYADGMNLPNKAIETLEEGFNITRGDPSVHYELAVRLRASGEYDHALAHLHGLLISDPTRAHLWEELARTFEEAGRPAEAMLALAPLELLGDVSVVHAITRRLRPASAPPGSFDAEALSTISVNGAGASVATDLLAAIADAVGKLYTVDLTRLGVNKQWRVDGRLDHPLATLASRIAEIFNTHCEIYEHPAPTPLVSVEMTDPPTILLSEAARQLPSAQQAFLLAFATAQIANRTYPAAKVATDDLRTLLSAATRSVIPEFGRSSLPGEEEKLEALSQRLRRAIPRRWRRHLEVAAAEFAESPASDLHSWQKSLRQSALRAATLVADDLTASVQAASRLEGLRDVDGPALIKASPAIADLLYFWVSEPALRIRRNCGLL
jgi:tetratricopeptide (TPR) repeat protein